MACASKTLPLGLGGGELKGSWFWALALALELELELELEFEAGAAFPVVPGPDVAVASRGIAPGWRVVIAPRPIISSRYAAMPFQTRCAAEAG